MIRNLFVAAIAALAAVAGASVASAQGTGCEDAAARVSTSGLPRVGAREWNDWVTLTGCGSRGATIIGGAMQSGAIRGETELTRLDHLAGILDGWFQPQLIAAYQALIRSPDASNAIRLRVMWLLSGLYAPQVDVAGPLQGYMSARCETYGRSTALRDAPQSLPAAAYDQAVDAVAAVADDRTAPEYLRTTATCWQGVIRDELKNGTEEIQGPPVGGGGDVVVAEPAPVVVQPPVRIVYDCGSRFVFYNDVDYDLAVRYTGYEAGGMLRIVRGGPFIWTGARFGPVHFWLGDRELWYSDAVYRPCGGDPLVAPAIHIWTGWHFGLGVFFNAGYFSPRYVRPRVIVPVIGRPIIINRRDDGPRRDGSRNEGWRDPRDGRRPDGRPDGRSHGRPDGRPDGGNSGRPDGTTDPRGTPTGPRTAVPRDGGSHNVMSPDIGQRYGNVPFSRPVLVTPRYVVPQPRQAEATPRTAVPRNCCAVRSGPAPAPTQRSAQPSSKGDTPGSAQRGGGHEGDARGRTGGNRKPGR